MTPEDAVAKIQFARECFVRSTSVLEETDSGFAAVAGMYTVAQQVAHTALDIDWFTNGVKSRGEWDVDFERADERARAFTSLFHARELIDQAFGRAVEEFGSLSTEDLAASFPQEDPFFPGAPIWSAVAALIDHTAHHRGALTVYTRLLGKTPPNPYL